MQKNTFVFENFSKFRRDFFQFEKISNFLTTLKEDYSNCGEARIICSLWVVPIYLQNIKEFSK